MSGNNHDEGVRQRLARGLGRSFDDLKVRPKLMVLHNLFFLTLAMAVYFALLPLFDRTLRGAELREVSLMTQVLSLTTLSPDQIALAPYQYREGGARTLNVPTDIQSWLADHPGVVWEDLSRTDRLYYRVPQTGVFRELTVPVAAYQRALQDARVILFVVLGLIYLAAILVLERVIMPYYVYRPLRLMLGADAATQAGDREHELIDERQLLDDEIGQIMRSRNQTVRKLRRHEDELATALMRLEHVNRDLQGKNSLLESQDRLVSLGMLSASVAHELNTPLAVLHGSVEKLLETVPDPPAQDRLARMLRVTQRLRKISESLLDFARVRRHETEPVPMRSLVEEAWSLVAIDPKAAQVAFRDEIPENEAVMGNTDRLMQVFVNLLRNAVNAVNAPGEITVRSELERREDRDWVHVMVEDSGPGIPADILPNLFEAFVSTRLDSKGTGLGLTVAEGIVQQHGGAISASNRPGGGARIEVVLPAASQEVMH